MYIPIPKFFKTQRPDIDVSTERARALAVVTQAPQKSGDAQAVEIGLATGIRTTGRDVIMGSLEGPYLLKFNAGGVLLAAKPGVRYFIHSISLAARNVAADTSTGIYVTGTIGGVVSRIAQVNLVPLVAGVSSGNFVIDALMDVNTALTATNETAVPTGENFAVSYVEVGTV